MMLFDDNSTPPLLSWPKTSPQDSSSPGHVLSHLRRLLNTRVGSVPACPTYGLLDLSDLMSELPQAASSVARRIETAIRTFEPRLCDVHVTQEATQGSGVLHFCISAQLAADRRPIVLRSQVSAAGKVRIAPCA